MSVAQKMPLTTDAAAIQEKPSAAALDAIAITPDTDKRQHQRPDEERLAAHPIRDHPDERAAQRQRQHPQHRHQRDEQRRFGDLERVEPEHQELQPPHDAREAAHHPHGQKAGVAEQETASAHQL